MRNFFRENIRWVEQYFQKVKYLFDLLAIFFVFETFLYSVNFSLIKDFTDKEASALKIVFWFLIFIISLLLYVKTDLEYSQADDEIWTSIFEGAVLSKFLVRLIIFVMFSIVSTLFWRQLEISVHNIYFGYFWVGLICLLFLEAVRIIRILCRKVIN
jgi:hypothetical protein